MILKAHTSSFVSFLLFLSGVALVSPTLAGGRNALYSDEKLATEKQVPDKPIVEETYQGGLEQTLEYNFSPDDRARLRKALADYSKTTDPEHTQIEQRRKAMQESVEARFNQCNKDIDDSLDREEVTECLPQIARHFNYVDVDENGVITLEELQLAQAKLVERRKAAEARMEAQKIQEAEAAIKNKSKANEAKQAVTGRKRPS